MRLSSRHHCRAQQCQHSARPDGNRQAVRSSESPRSPRSWRMATIRPRSTAMNSSGSARPGRPVRCVPPLWPERDRPGLFDAGAKRLFTLRGRCCPVYALKADLSYWVGGSENLSITTGYEYNRHEETLQATDKGIRLVSRCCRGTPSDLTNRDLVGHPNRESLARLLNMRRAADVPTLTIAPPGPGPG